MKLIDKDALIAEIDNRQDKIKKGIFIIPLEGRQRADATFEYEILGKIKDFLNTLEVKEVDLNLITGWLDHIAQIADDRMTLTRQRMTDAHALDEIKCIAKDSSEFITKYYKTQKGE